MNIKRRQYVSADSSRKGLEKVLQPKDSNQMRTSVLYDLYTDSLIYYTNKNSLILVTPTLYKELGSPKTKEQLNNLINALKELE